MPQGRHSFQNISIFDRGNIHPVRQRVGMSDGGENLHNEKRMAAE